MTTTALAGAGGAGWVSALRRLWRRELDSYPTTGYRSFLLGIAVVSNIMLVWTVSAGAAAAPVALTHYSMSLSFYSYLLVVAGSVGGLASYISSFGDRWGRANMVVIGLLINGLFALVALPAAPSKWGFSVLLCVLYLADGAIFVGTPALVRDFSPQMQRGLAMGFWTFGPVAGALIISTVAHAILPVQANFHDWQVLYQISGIACLAWLAVALVTLRELSPGLRSQRMALLKERALVEARARGLDVREAMARRWRQMLHANIVVSPIAVNLFLLIYFTATSYFVFYFTTVLRFSLGSFNGLQQIYWGVNVAALVVFGLLSDWLKVRKPFMLAGAIGTVTMILIIMRQGPGTSYATLAIELSALAAMLGCSYCPWFASFTETLEARNPALIATGTSLYGFATRLVLVPVGVIFPAVVASYNTILDNQAYAKYVPVVKRILAQHGPLIAAVQRHAALFSQLARYHPPTSAPPVLLAQAAQAVGGPANLVELGRIQPQVALLQRVGPHLRTLQTAIAAQPHQWNHWFYACVGGVVVFVPLIFTMVGRWNPAKARADAREHAAKVDEELTLLHAQPAAAGDLASAV
jgi:MFS family permease